VTLDTRVIIQEATNAREVFDFCRDLLGAPADLPFDREPFGGNPAFWNPCGVGLPAWLIVQYGPDGPLLRDDDCNCEDGYRCLSCRKPDGFIEVSFDTAYGYRGSNGEGCGDLHAALVDRLGAWCDQRRLSWAWYNEFTGEWFAGREGLSDLGDGGRAAMEWYTGTALPAIARGMST
jgi:hypothetical protein